MTHFFFFSAFLQATVFIYSLGRDGETRATLQSDLRRINGESLKVLKGRENLNFYLNLHSLVSTCALLEDDALAQESVQRSSMRF